MALDAAAMRAVFERAFPGAVPLGFTLRAAFPDRWLRIHSLPDARRYPADDADWAELSTRHETVATSLIGPGAPCVVLLACCETEPPACGLSFAPVLDLVHEGATWRVHGASFGWEFAAFEPLLRAVAEDACEQVLVIEPRSGRTYAPYDGGADLYFPTRAERNLARGRFVAWRSTRPDGL